MCGVPLRLLRRVMLRRRVMGVRVLRRHMHRRARWRRELLLALVQPLQPLLLQVMLLELLLLLLHLPLVGAGLRLGLSLRLLRLHDLLYLMW